MLAVTAGSLHCLAVTEMGEFFSWGNDTHGQCGHGGDSVETSHFLPRRVEALASVRVRSASAGSMHSLVLTEEGAFHSFGKGGEGRLGHCSVDDEHSPKMVDALRRVRIVAAAAGSNHSLALAEDGTVLSWFRIS